MKKQIVTIVAWCCRNAGHSHQFIRTDQRSCGRWRRCRRAQRDLQGLVRLQRQQRVQSDNGATKAALNVSARRKSMPEVSR